MSRLNVALALAVLASAFWLIRTSNEARSLFVQLERARTEEQELEVQYDRLKVERRTAATPLVVEDMVRTRLKMSTTNPAVTHYVIDGAVPAAKPAAAAGGAP